MFPSRSHDVPSGHTAEPRVERSPTAWSRYDCWQMMQPRMAATESLQDAEAFFEEHMGAEAGRLSSPAGRFAFPRNEHFERLVVSSSAPIVDRFEFNRSTLTSRHRKRLRLIARHIHATWQSQPWRQYRPIYEVTIIGHTDRVGSEGYNETLGLARANAAARGLRRELRRLQVGLRPLADRIFIRTMTRGKTEPVRTPLDAAQNRRVEMFLTGKDPTEVLPRAVEVAQAALSSFRGLQQDERDIIECLLGKMTDLDLDDRYTQELREPLRPYKYPHLRDGFLRAAYRPDVPVAPTDDEQIWEQTGDNMIRHLRWAVGFIESAIIAGNKIENTTGGATRWLYPTVVWLFNRIRGKEPSMLECFD